MMVPTTGVAELVIESRNLQAAEHLYSEELGLPVVSRRGTPN